MVKHNLDRNLISIIIGYALILIGLTGVSIILPLKNNLMIIIPGLSLIIGAILALMGGLGKWR